MDPATDHGGGAQGWLLLLAQLPKAPSSARVALWRRLRAAGATTVINGAWVLPQAAAHARFLAKLREDIRRRGGTVLVLAIPASSPDADAAITARFAADRAKEYDEFTERCAALLAEISKEAANRKYTFAETEENEQDLDKLGRWLAKIKARDFFPGDRQRQAAAMLARCRAAVEAFAQAAYATEDESADRFPGTDAPAGARSADGDQADQSASAAPPFTSER